MFGASSLTSRSLDTRFFDSCYSIIVNTAVIQFPCMITCRGNLTLDLELCRLDQVSKWCAVSPNPQDHDLRYDGIVVYFVPTAARG
jgi:hypothetical protein